MTIRSSRGTTSQVKYPDTPQGAVQLLKDLSSLDITGDLYCMPDPAVLGVWKVISQNKFTAIVYMAGYPDPFGVRRVYNDFEVQD